jgi:serine phosphatase RsbU (regulator of sigma subunit)
MQRLLLLAFLFFSAGIISAQDDLSSRIRKILDKQESDSLKFVQLSELSGKAAKKNVNDGLQVIKAMEELSKGNKNLSGLVPLYKGDVYRRNFMNEKALDQYHQVLPEFERLKDYSRLAKVSVAIALTEVQAKKPDSAEEWFKKALNYAKSSGKVDAVIEVIDDFSSFYSKRNAVAAQFALLTDQVDWFLKEKPNEHTAIASAYMDLAYYYYYLENFKESYKYCELSRPYAEKSGDELRRLDVYNTGGSVLKALKNPTAAAIELQRAADLLENPKSAYRKFLGAVYVNLGTTYYELGETEKGFEYKKKALEFFRGNNDEVGEFNTNIAIGIDLVEVDKKPQEAVKFLHDAEAKADNYGTLYNLQHLYRSLHQAYALARNYERAYHYFEKFTEIKDSSYNSDRRKQLGELEAKYESGKKEQQIEMLNRDKKINQLMLLRNQEALDKEKVENEARQNSILLLEQESSLKEEQLAREKAQTEAERNKALLAQEQKNLAEKEAGAQRRINMLFGGASLLLIVFLVSLYRGYRNKKKANEEILEQKSIIEQQKLQVEEKNREVVDSITYAKRLQDAILPPAAFVGSLLPENFVYYKPKDIVAGDFYWVERGRDALGNELVFLAVADCTGHGVPGAMVSVVCSNALNRSVKEFGLTNPGIILDKVTDLVLETFSRSESEVNDGMDISLAVISSSTGELQWAGANNPLWILRNNEIIEYKANKQPVGRYDHRVPFTSHTIQLSKNDLLYLFSDGYCDQFGGEKGKKFKEANLRRLLLSISNTSLSQQKEQLHQTIINWMGKLEQIDDICLIGVRV